MARSSSFRQDLLSHGQRLRCEFAQRSDSMEAVWDLLRLSPGLFRTSMDFLYSKHCKTMFFGIMRTIFGAVIPWQKDHYRAWKPGSWAEYVWLNDTQVKGKSINKQPLTFFECFCRNSGICHVVFFTFLTKCSNSKGLWFELLFLIDSEFLREQVLSVIRGYP